MSTTTVEDIPLPLVERDRVGCRPIAPWSVAQRLWKARLIGNEGYIRQRDGWAFLCEHGLIVQVTVYPESDIDDARAAAERLVESRG